MSYRGWIKERFNRTVDRFLPPGYSVEHTTSLGRARILVALLLYHLLMSLAIIALAFFSQPEDVRFTAIAAGFSLSMMIMYIGFLYLFRLTGSILWCGHLFTTSMFVAIVSATFLTGGFRSPVLQILLALPVLVFLIAGRRAGFQWLVITVITSGGFYSAQLHHIPFRQILLPDAHATINLGVWVLMAVTVMACFLIYDVVNDSLQRQLSRERGRFAHQAAHDVLTELPNRNEFYRRLKNALSGLHAGQRLAIAYLDLDGFKPINDRYGHHTGDEVLKIISQRLVHSVRREDTVARLGGDEFAILMRLDPESRGVESLLDKLLARIAEPIRCGDNLVRVSGSIGVAFAPDHGEDMDSLLKVADRSMYQAKQEKNRFCIFDPADESPGAQGL